MKNLQRIRKPVIVLAVIAAVAMGAMRLSAFNPQPDPPAFGLVAMTPSEAARFTPPVPTSRCMVSTRVLAMGPFCFTTPREP